MSSSGEKDIGDKFLDAAKNVLQKKAEGAAEGAKKGNESGGPPGAFCGAVKGGFTECIDQISEEVKKANNSDS
ncbi:hypothetical protein DdX_17044 [Ditylenchus destructor]|uniref:Uncharacterized protein n=1 Tax=Ditylenchus destructor TaxID=166010 RepID=A0AAD4QZC6_9BILA|nr:hypothetical protein DdX_17044 [Ditylenchus destructor]